MLAMAAQDVDVDVDVVVVGAGLAGLTAARELHRQGVDVVVLESADRVGGRSLRERTAAGSYVDLGGQWVGPDHDRVRALAAELGLELYPMHTGLLPELVLGGRRVRAVSPSVLVAGLAIGVAGVLAKLGYRGRRSSATVASALRRVPGRTARRIVEVTALISWTADLDRTSVGAMAALIRGQGGVLTMLSTKGGAQESLLVEGAGAMAEALAAELGSQVRLGERVGAIRRDDGRVTVRTAGGEVRARAAIVSVPPPVAARIEHDPPLPAARIELERTTYMGSVYKAIAVYPAPFWRTTHGGELLLLDHPGAVVYDTSPPSGPGHLCLLVGGPEARALDDLDPGIRRSRLLGLIAERVGEGVREPLSWHEKAWHLDEHAGGGYDAMPGLDCRLEGWTMPSAPVGRVHWAGAETAHHHPGYLDGAIESGLRAATEVRAVLAGP